MKTLVFWTVMTLSPAVFSHPQDIECVFEEITRVGPRRLGEVTYGFNSQLVRTVHTELTTSRGKKHVMDLEVHVAQGWAVLNNALKMKFELTYFDDFPEIQFAGADHWIFEDGLQILLQCRIPLSQMD